MTCHGSVLKDLTQQVDDPDQVHPDTEPQHRNLVGIQKGRGTGGTDDRQNIRQVPEEEETRKIENRVSENG